ncbi:hypothetical protein [Luteimicrobium subarcticum]|uniref:Uncharacterized protein n=1 Tax=Luteimicrobium subarcticum TaxID=620910 RepID=A0A2M8WR42_9MICO|nr:hypothetical protein [Luteimicrobium subarcticum]PJI93326.1 hypothetical protein CLV34_1895 [Luteimicrobium subarcticum]
MPLNADELLSGPRGRRLCLEVALRTDRAADCPSGALGSRATPERVADLLGALGPFDVDAATLADALDVAVATSRCWQDPDGEDVLAARPDVRAALRPAAQAVVGCGASSWWSAPLDRTDQWRVRFDGHAEAALQARGSATDDVLAAWRAEALETEAQFRAVDGIMVSQPPDPADAPGWAAVGGLPVHGPWWSIPPTALLGSTRPWSAGRAPGPATTGPVGLSLVEDAWNEDDATAVRVSVTPGARVLEIDGADAWADLCRRYPLDVSASRRTVWLEATGRDGRWLVPDWSRVARDVDAVHLTVAGYLATVGRAVDVGDGWATVLAGWDPDRTSWFRGASLDEAVTQRWHLDREVGWLRAEG